MLSSTKTSSKGPCKPRNRGGDFGNANSGPATAEGVQDQTAKVMENNRGEKSKVVDNQATGGDTALARNEANGGHEATESGAPGIESGGGGVPSESGLGANNSAGNELFSASAPYTAIGDELNDLTGYLGEASGNYGGLADNQSGAKGDAVVGMGIDLFEDIQMQLNDKVKDEIKKLHAKVDQLDRKLELRYEYIKDLLKFLSESTKRTMTNIDDLRNSLKLVTGAAFQKHVDSLEVFPLKSKDAVEQYLRDDPDLNLMYQRYVRY